ncbi:MAG TPA: methyl-accepting chemotaxis protein, partial [Deltaproteobacteria bacterium]|nr:methyl-accepting chemotaxis protein [Deltaproteobacteria bacterium]HPR55402.1 methyl-accepting chemotaxis protein [Deltaproteobacteria bacterium]HXK48237.1 methyl-accepting chemotaxis protein [Deltaproteobacteria bacterium]
MKESTRELYLRPLLFQENITAIILIPTLFFFFLKTSEGIKENIPLAILVAVTAGTIGLIIGPLVKYVLVKPAIDLMDKEKCSQQEIQKAVRSASVLPLAESVVVFLRWAPFAIPICMGTFYFKGLITAPEALFGTNALIMTALLVVPFFYLASENSLVPFYQHCKMKGILDRDMNLFRLSLSQKLFFTMLFVAVPPLGLIIGTIYLSIATGLNLASIQMGFFIILFETVLLTFINGFLLMKSLKISVGRMSFMFKDMAKGEGDLTKRLEVTGLNEVGELAFWFNEFMDNIEQIVGHVRE